MILGEKEYPEDVKFLYHGSQNGQIFTLEPRLSLEFKELVYATDDLKYALVRAGRQLDVIREEYHGSDKPMELAECSPKAFDKQFNCKGYIYFLLPKDFKKNPDTGEYYSEKPVTPIYRLDINNIWFRMLVMKMEEDAYDLHYYYDEDYWKNVRGGLEGFLERKLENKKKLRAMLDSKNIQ